MIVRPDRRTEDLRSWVADLVRSGLATPEDVRRQAVEAITADLDVPDPEALASRWIEAAHQAWGEDAATWPETTDHDRLEQAFTTLEDAGIAVLRGCTDHWVARDLLTGPEAPTRGVAWFTAPDVWHAIDEGMLEVNLWHASTANVAPGDQLLSDAVAAFAAAGLEAHFDEGRIEVAAYWRRRPTG